MSKDKILIKDDKALKEFSESIKGLQEKSNTPEWVGSKTKISTIKFNIQPHDCRLYFDFSKEGFNHKKPPEPTIKKVGGGVLYFNNDYRYSPANYEKEHHYFDFMGCTIMVKKTQVQVNINIHKHQWRQIEAYTINDIEIRLKQVIEKLNQHGIQTLRTFIDLHGGYSNFEVKKSSRCEIGIHGHDYLDNMPEKLIIRDTYFKKLYKRKVEIYESMYKPISVKNTMTNLILKDVVPEIANELGSVKETILEMLKQNKTFYSQMGGIISGNMEVMKTLVNLNKGFTDLNMQLTQLKQQQQPPSHRISRELQTLLYKIKKPKDMFKYKAKIILLSKEEKRILDDYTFSL